MTQNNNYRKGLVTATVCCSIAFFGITMYFWGAMLPIVGAQIEGVDSLPWLLTLGIILGTVVCGSVMDRYGYKWLLVLSCLAIAAGLILFAYSHDLYLFILSALLIGAGGGVLNSETIAIISDLYDDAARGTMLGILGGSYCFGSLLWTIICRVWIATPLVPVMWSAALIIVLTILFMFVKFPPAKVGKGEGLSFIGTLKLLKNQVLIVVSIVLFFQGIIEAISNTFCTSYLSSVEGGIGVKEATFTLIFLTVGMTVGRFSLSAILRVIGNIASLMIFLILAFAGAVMQKVAPTSFIVSIVSMFLIGFGVGATSPIAFNYLGQIFKKYSGIAVSVAVLVAQAGMLLGNYFVGKLFIQSNLESGMFKAFPIILGIGIILVIALFPLIPRSVKNLKGANLDI